VEPFEKQHHLYIDACILDCIVLMNGKLEREK